MAEFVNKFEKLPVSYCDNASWNRKLGTRIIMLKSSSNIFLRELTWTSWPNLFLFSVCGGQTDFEANMISKERKSYIK